MSRARHKRENGGKVKETWYNAKDSEVAKDARDEKEGGDSSKYKKGGRVHGEGHEPKHRADHMKRARGGAVPGRKRGGGVGADKMPLSTASRVKHVTKGESPEHGDDEVM